MLWHLICFMDNTLSLGPERKRNLQAVNERSIETRINLIEMLLNSLCRNQMTAE